jgi:epoxyqueuosine reductase
VRHVGLAAGLDAVGIATAARFEETRSHLEDRKAAGLHGGMAFTYRNPGRSTDPARILRDARALVVGARRYPSRRPPPEPDRHHPAGIVARYASADHYGPLRQALEAVARRLRDEGWRALVVADDNALVDREAARQAGIGWYGKNTNLLLPGQGSWFVLGSVVTDAPLPTSLPVQTGGCGPCRRCLPGCPTGALIAPGVLDARRCLAWLLQAPGIFPVEYRVALGGRLYGCDDCQEACPDNAVADRGASDRGASDRSAAVRGAADGRPSDRFDPGPGDQPTVDLLELLAASDGQLLAWLGRWYIPQRQPRYLRRNALIALGNTADGSDRFVEEALRRCLDDPDPIIRAHAVWTAARLGRADLLSALADDGDVDVRRELDRVAADLT